MHMRRATAAAESDEQRQPPWPLLAGLLIFLVFFLQLFTGPCKPAFLPSAW